MSREGSFGETLLRYAFDTFLLLLFSIQVEVENGLSKTNGAILSLSAGGDEFPTMRTDDAELLDMLAFSAPLAVDRRSACSVMRTSRRVGLRARRKSARSRGRRVP
jgi:hypothetical protein